MYYSDKPIETSKDDQLGRSGFSKMLAQSLLNLTNSDTFTIGLFGKWGSGKTSIVNMVLNELEEQQKKEHDAASKLIVVHFEPWNFSDANQLLIQFFVRLSNEFRSKGDKRMEKIGKALEKYSGAFDLLNAVPNFGGILSILGKTGANALSQKIRKGSDENDILKQKENVIELLKQQKNRILIIIDDIDRLSNEQIRQVFQLVTSVAKFPNIIYLLVFDKDIVVKALEKVQEGNGQDYLEKVIQMPIQIPDASAGKLNQAFVSKLNSIIKDNNQIFIQQERWNRLYQSCIEPFILSIRDINRLCNSIQFKLTALAAEVDFFDMIAISGLQIAMPDIYEWIKKNKELLTGDNDITVFGNRNMTQKDWYEFHSAQVRTQLLMKDQQVVEEYAEIAMGFLSHLFPYFGHKIGKVYEEYDLGEMRKYNRIAHPEKFDRYFTLDVDGVNLKKSEILYALHIMPYDELITFLLELDKNNDSYEFLEEIKAMISDVSSARAREIIKALFSASSGLTTQKDFFTLSTHLYADHLALHLLERIDPKDRLSFMADILSSGDPAFLPSAANVINMMELGYGRLAANGVERDYNKALTLEELIELEKLFAENMKIFLSRHNLFDLSEWRGVGYLLETFDPTYMKEYLLLSFRDHNNIVKYMAGSVNTWTGTSVEYEIGDDYKKYLSEEEILQSIEMLRRSGELFTLPNKIQNKCSAFQLNKIGQKDNLGCIPQSDVDDLLATWKKEWEEDQR